MQECGSFIHGRRCQGKTHGNTDSGPPRPHWLGRVASVQIWAQAASLPQEATDIPAFCPHARQSLPFKTGLQWDPSTLPRRVCLDKGWSISVRREASSVHLWMTQQNTLPLGLLLPGTLHRDRKRKSLLPAARWEAVVKQAGIHVHPEAQLPARLPPGQTDSFCSNASSLQKPALIWPPPGSLHSVSSKPHWAQLRARGRWTPAHKAQAPYLSPQLRGTVPRDCAHSSDGRAEDRPKTHGQVKKQAPEPCTSVIPFISPNQKLHKFTERHRKKKTEGYSANCWQHYLGKERKWRRKGRFYLFSLWSSHWESDNTNYHKDNCFILFLKLKTFSKAGWASINGNLMRSCGPWNATAVRGSSCLSAGRAAVCGDTSRTSRWAKKPDIKDYLLHESIYVTI